MTHRHELIKKYHRGESITVCFVSFHDYNAGKRKTIEHKLRCDGTEYWINLRPPVKDYQNYLRSICPQHIEEYYSLKGR